MCVDAINDIKDKGCFESHNFNLVKTLFSRINIYLIIIIFAKNHTLYYLLCYEVLMFLFTHESNRNKGKISSYIAQYPVLRIAQNGLAYTYHAL